MIYLDSRAGSKELAPYLPEAEVCLLPAGDILIPGNGPRGPCSVCIEVKKLPDLLDGLNTGRLKSQLDKMRLCFDYSYLLLIGRHKEGTGPHLGRLMIWSPSAKPKTRGKWVEAHGCRSYRQFRSRLHTVTTQAGVAKEEVAALGEAATVIQVLADWWGRKWDDHSTLKLFHSLPLPSSLNGHGAVEAFAARELPGIGWTESGRVAKRFKTVLEVAGATMDELQGIHGVGQVKAQRIYDWFRDSKAKAKG